MSERPKLSVHEISAPQVVEVKGPAKRGWVRLSLTPSRLEAPALVILTCVRAGLLEPFARIVVGPDRTVTRAVFLPGGGRELEMHVFSRSGGTVRLGLEDIGPVQLFAGLRTRLKDMRHLGWHSIGERALAALRRGVVGTQAVGPVPLGAATTFASWLEKYGSIDAEAIEALKVCCLRGPRRHVVLLDARDASADAVERTRAAIAQQILAPDDVITLSAAVARPAIRLTAHETSTVLFWVEAGDEPAEHAFLALAAALEAHDGIAVADWIEVSSDGRVQPVFTPGWDAVRAAAGFELSGAIAVHGRALRQLMTIIADSAGGALARRGPVINSLAAPLTEQSVRHLPYLLTRVPARHAAPVSAPPVVSTRRPLASLVVPTHARAELLSRCVASCFDRTSYGPLELIVVDHASTGAPMEAALAEIKRRKGTTVLHEEGPFNYSRLISAGVERASGELIVLLNDDVEAMSDDWLLKLAAMLDEPGIGIVGPRLLYPEGRIQHNGVVLGMGGPAGHPGRRSRPDERNPNRVDPWPRTVSAVTGACLLIRHRDFDAAGGMDESLAIEFNDVDLCLRVAARGLRCVVDPRVTLIHHEQATRASRPPTSVQRSDRATFANRWGHVLADDPWFSPNLALDDDSCGLANPPRTPRCPAARQRILVPEPRC